jgi:chromosome segregation ATPase
MCRKAIFTSIAIALGLLVLSQTRVGSKVFGLAELAWNKIGIKVNKSVPIEWEIGRIDNEIAKLEKDIRKHFDVLAEEKVKVKNMQKEVELVRTNLKDRLRALEVMRTDLSDKTQKVIFYNDKEYTRSQVETKFAQDWKSYQVAEKNLEVKEKLLKQKQVHVEAFKGEIESFQTTRDTLRTEVLRLRTELAEVQATQNQCKVQVDGSRLADIKASLADVQNRIDVLKEKSALEGRFSNSNITIPVENKVEVNKALEEFETRFGDRTKVAADDK